VQFLRPDQAQAATELDGRLLDKQYHIVAKISDPVKKEDRHGALYEGREVYISNLNWRATEAEVKSYFSKCGEVEKVRIPRNLAGKSKGVAFLVFKSKEDAERSVSELHNTPFQERTLTVVIAVPMAKRTATTLHAGPGPSESPEPFADGASDARTARQRTIALMNIPDTVNSARLEALLTPFGAIRKLTLRPDHAGAIAEFAEEKSVGSAGLGLEGVDLDGKRVRVGTVRELFNQGAEVKSSRLGDKKKVERGIMAKKPFGGASGVVARPSQARRGGLGIRLGGLGATVSQKADEANSSAGKSNADFRDMFLKGKHTGDGIKK
jgi:RNA recognition motif-containing protein